MVLVKLKINLYRMFTSILLSGFEMRSSSPLSHWNPDSAVLPLEEVQLVTSRRRTNAGTSLQTDFAR